MNQYISKLALACRNSSCSRNVNWAIMADRSCRSKFPLLSYQPTEKYPPTRCYANRSSFTDVKQDQASYFSAASDTYSSTTSNKTEYGEHTSSVDQEEVDKFSIISQSWWDKTGEFQALHNLNELRVPLIRDALCNELSKKSKPLEGVSILDVGCGGGILSEPLARLGAEVTGLDASPENITIATDHAKLDSGLSPRLQYKCCAVENLDSESNHYDGVVASEILEHVANPQKFITACCNLVKPGGSLFITTLNQTWLSYYIAVIAAERIFKIVPQGAHDWDKFIPPTRVTDWLTQDGFQTLLLHGMTMNPLSRRWCWIKDTSINYAIHAVKLKTN